MDRRDSETRPIAGPAEQGPDELLAALVEADLAAHELPQPASGDLVGRYTVLSLLGRGGMGAVYKAYDPQLDRNVAVKLLRRVSKEGESESELRLLREAQTLARFHHPNVVAVYDVGLTGLGMFIAMELVEGQTLQEWLEHRRPRVSAILEVFRGAGWGLVAVHEAGFVHRDFKPSNVLVGPDGSVRVLDFGIASLTDPLGDEADPTKPSKREIARPPGILEPHSISVSGAVITDDGVVVGTPAYMAPEQLLGDRADHRSEQFAFCVCLHLALYGRLPLAGESFEERRQNLGRGRVLDDDALFVGETMGTVPPRVRRALLRGLSVDPATRFGSMRELLAELEPAARRWPLVLGGLMLAASFSTGAAVFYGSKDACEDPLAALEGVWGPEDHAAVQEAFDHSGHVDAPELYDRVEQQLDEYAGQWMSMYAESCRATFVTQQQSELLYDHRMRCLGRRRDRMRSAIDALAGITGPRQAIGRTLLPFVLPPLAECAELDTVMAANPVPSDAAARERIVALRGRIDEVETLQAVGELQAAMVLAQDVVDDAREAAFAPVLAEALGSLGSLQVAGGSAREGQATLEASIAEAALAKDDLTAARAWTWLIFALVQQHRLDEAQALELAAKAAVDRANDDEVRGWLLNNLGALYSERDDFDRSRWYLQQALAIKTHTLGPSHVDVGISWTNLGTALADERHHEQARDAFERARAVFEATVGTAHPLYNYAVEGLCLVEEAEGRHAQAVSLCARVLEHFDASPGSNVTMGNSRFVMARALRGVGRTQEAEEQARFAIELVRVENPTLAAEIVEWLGVPAAVRTEAE